MQRLGRAFKGDRKTHPLRDSRELRSNPIDGGSAPKCPRSQGRREHCCIHGCRSWRPRLLLARQAISLNSNIAERWAVGGFDCGKRQRGSPAAFSYQRQTLSHCGSRRVAARGDTPRSTAAGGPSEIGTRASQYRGPERLAPICRLFNACGRMVSGRTRARSVPCTVKTRAGASAREVARRAAELAKTDDA
jgi:hypothetical protein